MSSLAVAFPTQDLVLGRYRPFRPLGSGGNGSVWLARDERNGLDVALKIIPREGKGAARAEREALAARRLRHDRCVRAYDIGHDASHVYIAYEYVPGRTVREALESNALSDRHVVEIAAQVLDALAHAHRAGIVHRDVKPSNVLLENGKGVAARLLDFGLAQFDGADTLTAVGDVPGTLAYIAPERLAGEDATAASDVWAVGVFLWEALAGKHPFWGMPLQQVAKAIESGAPPLATVRPDLPRRLVTAVDRALHRNPEARPRASELAAHLRAALHKPERGAERQRTRPRAEPRPQVPAATLAARVVPAGLAAMTAGLGATLLPFWPPLLVVAIVLAAAVAAAFHPRVGLALALSAPLFPLGNEARGAALLYGAFALVWLAMTWNDARRGLLLGAGPLLAPLGVLSLIPLAAQPARGALRRAAQAGGAVLAAALVAGTSGAHIPFTSAPLSVDIAPSDGFREALAAVLQGLGDGPVLLGATILAALAAASLPLARARSRYGVAAVGLVVVAGSLAAGAGWTSAPLVTLVWAGAALLAARTAR